MTPLPGGGVIFSGTGGNYNFRAHQRESNYPDNPLAIILIARRKAGRRRERVSASLERHYTTTSVAFADDEIRCSRIARYRMISNN